MTRRLKILHVISGDLWAGAEAQAFTLISHLVRLPDTDVSAVVMNEGTLVDKLRLTGIRVHVADERKLWPLQIVARLRSVLNDWRPDVIHTHREKENILGTVASRTCRSIPLVRTMHGGMERSGTLGWRVMRHRTVAHLDRWCIRASRQTVIAVSKEMGIALARDFPVEQVVVIENGVDTEAVGAQKGVADFHAAAPGSTHIGIVGRLVQVKRVDLFLEAAALLRRLCPERRWRFHVFGDGPARSSLVQISERMRISDVVTFHGHRRDIATCIGGLDALVICSDHEGMPMTALEAAALGVPTVAHAVGGLIDVLPKECLVVRQDAEGYSDAVLRAIGEDGRAIARRYATETSMRYSATRNAERTRALYEQVIAQRDAE